MKTIAQIQIDGIKSGLSTKGILEEVLKAYPNARTSKACVAWYRSHLKHDPKFAKHRNLDPEVQKALDSEYGEGAKLV